MKMKHFSAFLPLIACVLFAYGTASGQVVEKVKDTAEKAKDATVETAKKTGVVITNGLDKAAAVTTDGTKKTVAATKTFGNNALVVTEDVAVTSGEKIMEGGRFLTVTTWDGAKWVSKQVWFAAKKGAEAVKP